MVAAVVKQSLAKKHEHDTYSADFYDNIWSCVGEAKKHGKKVRHLISPCCLIDIDQVAFVIATGNDYQGGYETPWGMTEENMWADAYSALDSITYVDSDQVKWDLMSPIQSRYKPKGRLKANSRTDVGNDTVKHAVPEPAATPGLVRTNAPEVLQPTQGDTKLKHLDSALDDATPVPPPSTKNGAVVFSTIFVQDRSWDWSIKFLLGIHEPMRHALFVMDRFLQQSRRQQAQSIALENHVLEFFSWFKTYFVEYLRTQHSIKMAVLYPLMTVKYSTKLEIMKCYEDVLSNTDRICKQEAEVCESSRRERSVWIVQLDGLQKDVRKLSMLLHSVLNLEEQTLHTALAATFTEHTFYTYVMPRLFRGIKSKRVVIPWIVERSEAWGGQKEKTKVQSMLPFSAKFLYRKIWKPYFMANIALTMQNLNEFIEETPAERRDGIFRCTIQ